MTHLDAATTSRLARANYEEFNREMSRWSGPEGRIEERDGVIPVSYTHLTLPTTERV